MSRRFWVTCRVKVGPCPRRCLLNQSLMSDLAFIPLLILNILFSFDCNVCLTFFGDFRVTQKKMVSLDRAIEVHVDYSRCSQFPCVS